LVFLAEQLCFNFAAKICYLAKKTHIIFSK